MFRKLVLGLALTLSMLCEARADSVTGLATRTGTDSVNWSQLGSCGAPVASGFTATSVNGIGLTGTLGGNASGQARVETTCGWSGDFALGDAVLWTAGNGPLTLIFNQGITGGGAQIQSSVFGNFTAQVCDNLGDCFSEAGNSLSTGDNTAIFIGLLDNSGPDLTSLTFSLTSCSQNCVDFAINELSLNPTAVTPTPTPEPGIVMLLAPGLLSLGCFQRRLRTKK